MGCMDAGKGVLTLRNPSNRAQDFRWMSGRPSSCPTERSGGFAPTVPGQSMRQSLQSCSRPERAHVPPGALRSSNLEATPEKNSKSNGAK